MPAFHLQDSLNMLEKLTFRRIWNAFKVYSGFLISRITRKPIPWGMPMAISFEPTTSCNLRCPECPSGLRSFTRPKGMLAPAFFNKTINEISKEVFYLIFYFQGEPYLNPNFLDMVKYATAKKMYTATSTNAHYLTDEMARRTVESGLNRLIISIDGTTQEVYEKYRRGGNLQKVIEGSKNIVKWKRVLKSKTPFIIFQFLVVRHNEHQIDDVKALAAKIGVDQVRFKTAQVYDYENDPNQLIPQNERYSRYKKTRDGHHIPKQKMANHCWKMWNANVITFDGRVVPCCFDKDAKHKMGDLNESSFREIWNGKAYQRFRNALWRGRKNIDICANCSEGTSVWK
ncbi:MAG: SPASM domain-containing protein [Ferruginibacter sp.]|nr:SPASM domain-containing protein [Ferruginibacter sp.]